jgi:outer membrane protein TolC
MIRNHKLCKLKFATIIVLALSSCTLEPVELTNKERADATKEVLDKLHVTDHSEVLKINLRQAIALALENNLEYMVKKIQSALQYKQYDLAKTDLYPNIDLNYDYYHRNRDFIKTLVDIGGDDADAASLVPHTIKSGQASFNWDILDFGLSYVRAKQAADRYLIELEQRKQMASRIINSVIKNFLNKTALPSITGLLANAPTLPKPNTAEPFDITATKFPLLVYL